MDRRDRASRGSELVVLPGAAVPARVLVPMPTAVATVSRVDQHWTPVGADRNIVDPGPPPVTAGVIDQVGLRGTQRQRMGRLDSPSIRPVQSAAPIRREVDAR